MGTHDFITFPPILDCMSPRIWMLLGEVQATIQVLQSMPLQPDDAYELQTTYLARGLHGTAAIEGNTLTELEVQVLVRGDARLISAQHDQLRQIQNLVAAYAAVTLDVVSTEMPPFSLELLNRYHELVMDELVADKGNPVTAGELRAHNVEVGRYLAPAPDDCGILLEKFCVWLNADEAIPVEFSGHELSMSILKAIVAHVYFAWIHPYGDGNGRMARLLEHAILLGAGVQAAAAHIPSYYYNKTREQYYHELQVSHGEFVDGAYHKAELRGFIVYALEGMMSELGDLVLHTDSAQVQVLWRDIIRGYFPLRLTTAQQRRLRLAIDLTDRCVNKPLSFGEIWDLLDVIPAGAFEYSDIMLDRDLNALVSMGLLIHEFPRFKPNPEIMRSLFGNTGIKAG